MEIIEPVQPSWAFRIKNAYVELLKLSDVLPVSHLQKRLARTTALDTLALVNSSSYAGSLHSIVTELRTGWHHWSLLSPCLESRLMKLHSCSIWNGPLIWVWCLWLSYWSYWRTQNQLLKSFVKADAQNKKTRDFHKVVATIWSGGLTLYKPWGQILPQIRLQWADSQ